MAARHFPGNASAPPLSFEEFQNRARLYVLGALYPGELAEFKRATAAFGAKADRFIRECCALRDAFALSLRPTNTVGKLRDRLSSLGRRLE